VKKFSVLTPMAVMALFLAAANAVQAEEINMPGMRCIAKLTNPQGGFYALNHFRFSEKGGVLVIAIRAKVVNRGEYNAFKLSTESLDGLDFLMFWGDDVEVVQKSTRIYFSTQANFSVDVRLTKKDGLFTLRGEYTSRGWTGKVEDGICK